MKKTPRKKATVADPDLSHIAEPLRSLAVGIRAITPDPKNARRHDEANLRAIHTSLKRFGQLQPLVVNHETGLILAGNARYAVAKQLGWTHVAVVYVKHDAREATGFALADNRTAELATWDDTLLAELLADLKQSDSPDDADLVAALQLDALIAETVGEQTTTTVAKGQIVPELWQVIANCKGEVEQKALFDKLKGEGYDGRANRSRKR